MSYHLYFTDQAKDDVDGLKKAANKAALNKLLTLLEELNEHPFIGTGKPEPLRHNLSGLWSRRINKGHRLVYEVVENDIFIISAKGRY